MAAKKNVSNIVKLTEEEESEGYRVEQSGGNVLVWHCQNLIALLLLSPYIERRVQEVIGRKGRGLNDNRRCAHYQRQGLAW